MKKIYKINISLILNIKIRLTFYVGKQQNCNTANLHNTNTKMAENMLESTNIVDFDKIAKKA